MDQIIKYGGIDNIPLYNCSSMTPEEWLIRDGKHQPVLGTISLAYGILIDLLFIPTLIAMMSRDLIKLPCYKLMFFIGVVDIFAIGVNSIITGYLAIEGAVYCTHPHLIYISGMAGLGLWCCSCLANIMLLVNRILHLKNARLSNLIFRGNRTFFIICIPVIYGLFFVFFTPTCVFSSKLYAWFYDPNIFANRTAEYTNYGHGFNNVMIIVVICVLNIYIVFDLMKTSKGATKKNWKTHSILYQAILICVINQISSGIYVVMNFVEMPPWVTIFAHYLWQLDHSCPLIIYLTLNPTMRRRFWNTLRKNSVGTMPSRERRTVGDYSVG
ncbi:unnamed protein product [Caenorhabditis angaria]|uniref:Uncharacterized protein n=1 Tax=Caenorhabditis angaria TaxID=860376 RepID=A0A9P1IYJ7_9PELO|nr:unnamed protein product [Caenorhabditis angaria]